MMHLGRRTDEIDEEGKTTHYGYDALGRLTSVTDALGHVTSTRTMKLGINLPRPMPIIISPALTMMHWDDG